MSNQSVPSWINYLNYEDAYKRYAKYPIENSLSIHNGWCVTFIELDDDGNQHEECYLVHTKHGARYYRYKSLWYLVTSFRRNISATSILSNGEKVYLGNNIDEIDKDPMLLINKLIDKYGQSVNTNTSKSSRFI